MTTHTQNSDLIQTGSFTDALDFGASGDTWIIGSGVSVTSQTGSGVDSNGFSDNTLMNYGFIVSLGANKYGVNLYHGSELVVNAAGAEIISSGTESFSAAVHLEGPNGDHVDNLGTISAVENGINFDQEAAGIGVFNNGTIFGELCGIKDQSFTDGGTFTNAGTISSKSDAIVAGGNIFPTIVTTVKNLFGATISAPVNAIVVGTLELTNFGSILGNVRTTSSGTSVIINKGVITGQVLLEGEGNDTFNGAGGRSGAITATGNDIIILGKGSAQLHVGGGSDTITAGPGHDQFIFDSALAGQVEIIKKFVHGNDKIVLSLSDFAGLGTAGLALSAMHFDIGHATHANPEIVYNATNGFLFYDANGSAPGGLTHFATLAGHPAISHADFILEA
jgi:Ca2+-binding RTX toxin-like protein